MVYAHIANNRVQVSVSAFLYPWPRTLPSCFYSPLQTPALLLNMHSNALTTPLPHPLLQAAQLPPSHNQRPAQSSTRIEEVDGHPHSGRGHGHFRGPIVEEPEDERSSPQRYRGQQAGASPSRARRGGGAGGAGDLGGFFGFPNFGDLERMAQSGGLGVWCLKPRDTTLGH